MFAWFRALLVLPLLLVGGAAAAERPIIDAHVHYSHDAWEMLPPADAVGLLRQAGLKRAFVSSSSDDGTLKLLAEAPDLIVPVLRPYRRRGETGTWFRDDSVPAMLEARLAANAYAGIGEFHVFGADADTPVMQRVIALARQHRLFLHAHSDAEAVRRIFARDPQAHVLWAHSGFDDPATIRAMLERYPTLWCDLAFRSEQARDGKVEPHWRTLFEDFPDRFTLGTDTYVPERWHYVVEHAAWSRAWLEDLPAALADNIAWRNAERLADWAMSK